MTRSFTLLGLTLLACNVAVDGNDTGLSAGMSGPAATGMSNGDDATDDDTGGDDTDGSDHASTEATTDPATTMSGDDTEGATSGPPMDGSTSSDGSTGGDDTSPGDPLDPGLDVPNGGQTCMTPGSMVECPALEVCRFHTTEQGLCESCDVCGNLGAPCTEGTDCDILFACYQGQCTNICELGTFYCGPIEDCLDVGHPTHGVCAPF